MGSPLSATEGDNVTKKSANIPWYTGPSLLEHLEKVDISEDNTETGFYMPVQRVCRPDHNFRGFQGQIESGSISVGDEVISLPSSEKANVKQILAAGKGVEKAYTGQPVTITLDKEVDVSRGCVLVKDINLAAYKRLFVSLLWMDDSLLEEGGEYLVKLGTKTIAGIVTKIKYAIDVNTGEHIQAEKLSKNGIAACEILLNEAIVADKFEYHKTLGEFILIDRVTNMTSACGVVEEVCEKESGFSDRASFKYNGIEARGDIFEEFFYSEESRAVLKYQTVRNTYTVGDIIPTKGVSYNYPDSFDILVLRDGVAVKIRNKEVADILLFEGYTYENYPVINGRGFEIKAASNEDIQKLIHEYQNSGQRDDFFAKCMNFNTYREIALQLDYNI